MIIISKIIINHRNELQEYYILLFRTNRIENIERIVNVQRVIFFNCIHINEESSSIIMIIKVFVKKEQLICCNLYEINYNNYCL